MRIKESVGQKIFNAVNTLVMLAVALVCAYPLLYVVFASFSDASELMAFRGVLVQPLKFTLLSYKMVFNYPLIFSGYMNTIFIVTVGVAINIFLTSLGAYVLSRKNVYFQKHIMKFIVFTMFFNGGLVPFYFTVKKLGLDNTLWSVILPVAVNSFNLIIMRTSFAAIPDSMEESAKLDGAGHFTILFRIILPLAKATVAVMVLYYAVGHWNAWFNAMIFITDRALFPLQLLLRDILIENDTNQMTSGFAVEDQSSMGDTVKYAIVIVATVPVLAVYPFVQKYFAKGVMIGAVKG